MRYIFLFLVIGCAGNSTNIKPILSSASSENGGIWLEIDNEWRSEAFAPMKRKFGIYFCSSKENEVVCRKAIVRDQ